MSAEYLFQPDKHYDVRYDTGDKTIQVWGILFLRTLRSRCETFYWKLNKLKVFQAKYLHLLLAKIPFFKLSESIYTGDEGHEIL